MSSKELKNVQNKKALLKCNAFFKKKFAPYTLIFIILLMTILFLNSESNQKVIRIVEHGTNNVLWESDFDSDDWFSHRYIHSVEKSPVIEKFRVDEHNQIITMESWTKSFGAGMPYERQGTVDMIDGYYVISDLNRPVHGGVLQVKPSKLYPHTFHFKEQEVLLSEAPFVDKRLVIEIRNLTRYEKVVQLLHRSE